MPEACEPADVFLIVPSLYFSGEEKLQPEISVRSQAITPASSTEFLQFLGELACSRLLLSVDEREKRVSSEKASGRKKLGRAKRESLWASWQTSQSINYSAHFQKNRFSCQNARSRRDRETSFSVPIHPHVIICVGTGSILFVHPGGRAGVVDIGRGEGYWYLISRGWHIMTVIMIIILIRFPAILTFNTKSMRRKYQRYKNTFVLSFRFRCD